MKIGKTFTIDLDIYNWLEEHARQKERKVSYIVNMALRQIKQTTEQWKCPICKEEMWKHPQARHVYWCTAPDCHGTWK